MKNQKGFSLIELMVVVAIIGILSAIAVPNYQRFQRKARQSEAKGMLSGIFTSARTFHSEWGLASSAFEQIGFEPVGDLRYNHGFDGSPVGPTAAGNPGYRGSDLTGAMVDNTSAFCAIAANVQCARVAAFAPAAGGVAGAADPATPGPGQLTFIAASDGAIGGTVNDRWTMNASKVLQNSQDGTQ